MTLPLSLRLTLLYTLLLSLTLCTFGYLIYYQAEQHAYNDLYASLKRRAANVTLGEDLPATSSLSSVHGPVRLPGVNALGGDGIAIKVFDTRLTLLATTNVPSATDLGTTIAGLNASAQPWDREAAQWLLAHPYADQASLVPASRYSTITYEGQPALIYTTTNTTPGGIYIVQVASSEQSLQQSLNQLQQALLLEGLLAVLLALSGGSCLTRCTLAAVRRITRTACEISASQDFRRRVPLQRSLGRDEIVALVGTFNRMLANLEKAYLQQKRFIADASHELRAPIASICCNLDLLARAPDLPAGEVEAILADARAEADRMGRLVNDLLTLAHADEMITWSEKPSAHRQKRLTSKQQPLIDLDSLLLEVFRLYRGTGAEHRESYRPHLILQHIVPVQVYGEADRLKQVIVALLDNALKYTPTERSVTLSLNVDQEEAVLKVCDTGIGIAPEDLPHIFERFYRADRARSREQGGNGLGLAIVQSIIQEHQGRIEVESRPGLGSSFIVRLPAVSTCSLVEEA